MAQVIQTSEQQFYLSRLMGYDYTIKYRTGKTNTIADALSRVPDDSQSSLFIVSVPHFNFLEQFKTDLTTHPEFVALR